MGDTYSETWDLDGFFKGGSDSPEFSSHMKQLADHISLFEKEVGQFDISQVQASQIEALVGRMEVIEKRMGQAGAFIECLLAQDTTDRKANLLRGQATQLSASFENVLTSMDQKFVSITDETWGNLLFSSPLLESLSFVLNERGELAKEKLSLEQETLIQSLSVDGYHGWEDLYDTIVSQIKIPVEENGEVKELSVGQASNYFSSSDRAVRKDIFEKWEKAWGEKADLFAGTLNHLSGFRLGVYQARGWEHVLKEPLSYNRMSERTLATMWDVIAKSKAPLVKYLDRKAKILGVDKLSWYDLDAPIANANSKLSYQAGAEFILEQFAAFGKKLTAFTKKAFEDRWIEAEDRPNKAPGGFCTSFPESEQSRIFMTYSGTPSNVSTLAHELGHAFHQDAMSGVHPLNSDYAMNVAETASTFAEMIVADAAVKNAKTEEERLALLEDKVQRSVSLLMNIHARFIFETAFYEERKNGLVSVERLNELMVNAQKEAYADGLAEYHPHFWASKLHFYITDVPFYNFPYTFGYLFALGIYAKALEEGTAFEEKYIALLKDTGSMNVEDLAMKHLGVDLTERDFWETAIDTVMKDVEEFLEATE